MLSPDAGSCRGGGVLIGPCKAPLEVHKQVLERLRPPTVSTQSQPDGQVPHLVPINGKGQVKGCAAPGLPVPSTGRGCKALHMAQLAFSCRWGDIDEVLLPAPSNTGSDSAALVSGPSLADTAAVPSLNAWPGTLSMLVEAQTAHLGAGQEGGHGPVVGGAHDGLHRAVQLQGGAAVGDAWVAAHG